jgi:hypothetical protein
MPKSRLARAILSIVVLSAIGGGGFWLLQMMKPSKCQICQRTIHAASRAVIEENGKQESVCCARCALTLANQRHRPIHLVEVADFSTSKPLAPKDAFFVEGSRIVLCESHEPLFDQTKRPEQRVFDRCEPSVYAFAQRSEAEAFAATNGGVVLSFADLLKEVPKQSPTPPKSLPRGAARKP